MNEQMLRPTCNRPWCSNPVKYTATGRFSIICDDLDCQRIYEREKKRRQRGEASLFDVEPDHYDNRRNHLQRLGANRELRELMDGPAKIENEVDRLIDAWPRVVPVDLDIQTPMVDHRRTRSLETLRVDQSDVHNGAKVTLEETGGLCQYNPEIVIDRNDRMFTGHIPDIVAIHEAGGIVFDEGVYSILGDMLANETIYPKQRGEIVLNLAEQYLQTAEIISGNIATMLSLFPHVHCVFVYGNHGRIGTPKDGYKDYVNHEYLLFKSIEREWQLWMQQNPGRLSFNIPQAWFAITNIKGWLFLQTHGKEIRGKSKAALDRYTRDMRDMLQQVGSDFDYLVSAHRHYGIEEDLIQGERIQCPSFVGGDMLSTKSMTTSSRPSQKVFGVSEKRGITFRYNLYLDEEYLSVTQRAELLVRNQRRLKQNSETPTPQSTTTKTKSREVS